MPPRHLLQYGYLHRRFARNIIARQPLVRQTQPVRVMARLFGTPLSAGALAPLSEQNDGFVSEPASVDVEFAETLPSAATWFEVEVPPAAVEPPAAPHMSQQQAPSAAQRPAQQMPQPQVPSAAQSPAPIQAVPLPPPAVGAGSESTTQRQQAPQVTQSQTPHIAQSADAAVQTPAQQSAAVTSTPAQPSAAPAVQRNEQPRVDRSETPRRPRRAHIVESVAPTRAAPGPAPATPPDAASDGEAIFTSETPERTWEEWGRLLSGGPEQRPAEDVPAEDEQPSGSAAPRTANRPSAANTATSSQPQALQPTAGQQTNSVPAQNQSSAAAPAPAQQPAVQRNQQPQADRSETPRRPRRAHIVEGVAPTRAAPGPVPATPPDAASNGEAIFTSETPERTWEEWGRLLSGGPEQRPAEDVPAEDEQPSGSAAPRTANRPAAANTATSSQPQVTPRAANMPAAENTATFSHHGQPQALQPTAGQQTNSVPAQNQSSAAARQVQRNEQPQANKSEMPSRSRRARIVEGVAPTRSAPAPAPATPPDAASNGEAIFTSETPERTWEEWGRLLFGGPEQRPAENGPAEDEQPSGSAAPRTANRPSAENIATSSQHEQPQVTPRAANTPAAANTATSSQHGQPQAQSSAQQSAAPAVQRNQQPRVDSGEAPPRSRRAHIVEGVAPTRSAPAPAPATPPDAASNGEAIFTSETPERTWEEWGRLLSGGPEQRPAEDVPAEDEQPSDSAAPRTANTPAAANTATSTSQPQASPLIPSASVARVPVIPATTTPLAEGVRRVLRPLIGTDPAGVQSRRVAVAEQTTAPRVGDQVRPGADPVPETPANVLRPHEVTEGVHQRDIHQVPPVVSTRATPPYREANAAGMLESRATPLTRRGLPLARPEARPQSALVPTQPPARSQPLGTAHNNQPENVWGDLPAPWEPIPNSVASSWQATPPPTTPPTVAPPSAGAASSGAVVQRTPINRATTTYEPAVPPAQHEPEPQPPAPDLDALAQQVYAVLKQRLAAERRRFG